MDVALSKTHHLSRGALIASSSILLLFSIIHGPGRGISEVPAGHELTGILGILKVATYTFFLLGALAFPNRTATSAVALAIGLLAKGVTEVHVSSLRRLLGAVGEAGADWAYVTAFYLFTVVNPALLLVACASRLRNSKKLR